MLKGGRDHLSTRRRWVLDHGLQKVRGHNDGLALLPTAHHDLLLHGGHILQGDLGACASTIVFSNMQSYI